MKKFFYTVSVNIFYVLKYHFLPAVLMTAATAAVMLCAALIAAHVRGENAKYVLKKYAPAICSANALIFYVFFVLNATVLKRLSEPEYQPFSDIYGGWMVGELTYTYDFSALWNVIMFVPLCTFLFIFLKSALKRNTAVKQLFIISGISGFLFSGAVEILQIILKAGTFQFSDLVYNTLGSVLGVPVCLILVKIAQSVWPVLRRKMKIKQNSLN